MAGWLGWSLELEDRPDGIVDLLKLPGGRAAQVLDELAAGWTIDLQSERPAELPDSHRQQRAGVGVHNVHRIDRRQSIVGVHYIGGDDEPGGRLAGPGHHWFVAVEVPSPHAV